MKIIERNWDWWAYFWRVIHRQTIPHIKEWDRNVVRFIIEVLGMRKGDKLLDLGSGSGEHTRALAHEGIVCTGIEIAPSLVKYAQNRARQEAVSPKYICKDMRRIAYKDAFDHCIMVSGTFGFFSDTGNIGLLKKTKRALRLEGTLLLDMRNASYQRVHEESWLSLNGGYLLLRNRYNKVTHREGSEYIFIDEDGNVNVRTKNLKRASCRLYTVSEMKKMLHSVGLAFLGAFCGFRLPPVGYKASYKGNIVIIAKKLSSEHTCN